MTKELPPILVQLTDSLRQQVRTHNADGLIAPQWWYPAAAVISGILGDLNDSETLISALSGSCDPLGHRSCVDHQRRWRPFLYYWAKSYSLLFEKLPVASWSKWDEQLRRLADRLEGPLAQINSSGPLPAEQTHLIWDALGIYQVGVALERQAWTELAEAACWQLVSHDWPPAGNPRWIHAVDRYAVMRRHHDLRDHAESEYRRPPGSPWGLLLDWRKRDLEMLIIDEQQRRSMLAEPAPLTEAIIVATEFYKSGPKQKTMHPSMDGQAE